MFVFEALCAFKCLIFKEYLEPLKALSIAGF
jgi:hypothetical protein